LIAGLAGVEPMNTAHICPAVALVSVAVQPSPVSGDDRHGIPGRHRVGARKVGRGAVLQVLSEIVLFERHQFRKSDFMAATCARP